MSVWYAVVEHLGTINELAGQEVKISAVRMWHDGRAQGSYAHDAVAKLAEGRAWCRVFPTGSQVPTRGGIMRVRTGFGVGATYADMLSADEMLERVKTELETEREARRTAESERDALLAEVQRWRERASERAADLAEAHA
jgi:hypothetical protein